MQLYIIRHGQSTNNALADQWDRVFDPQLTDLGWRQAQTLAEHLARGIHPEQKIGSSEEDTGVRTVQGYGITRLFCSAMHRAMQTAQPIGTALKLNPEVWVDIHEVGGIFLQYRDERETVGYPGKTRTEILQEFPNYTLPDKITNQGWWDVNLGKEDWPSCQARAIRAAQQLRRWADSEERIAIVSHGGFIDSLVKALTNQLPGRNLAYHNFNTAMNRIDFLDNERIDIRYLNRVDHLPQELVS